MQRNTAITARKTSMERRAGSRISRGLIREITDRPVSSLWSARAMHGRPSNRRLTGVERSVPASRGKRFPT